MKHHVNINTRTQIFGRFVKHSEPPWSVNCSTTGQQVCEMGASYHSYVQKIKCCYVQSKQPLNVGLNM